MKTVPIELGVAVLGLGVGEQHARAYLSTGHCQLRWFYDLDAQRSRKVRNELNAGSVANNFKEILQDPQVQVISIASYDDAHFEQVLDALAAGKHLFVEKPLCRSLEELRRVRQAWRNRGFPHVVSNLVLRGAPLYQWLRRAIEAGEFGRIYAFDGDYLYGRIHKITQGWRKDVSDYSVIQGGGIHLVDLMLWLTSEKPLSVTAVGNRICTEGTPFRYNDYVSTTYRFPSGMIGRISANFGCVHRHQHVVRLFGTKATFIYDDQGARLHRSREPLEPPQLLHESPLPATKGELIPEFIEAIVEGKDTQKQTEHEFDLISACLAADTALASAREVEVVYR